MRHTFFVPVRTSKAGTLALQTGRLLTGERIGLAFTSEASLLLTLGPSQQWIWLDERALKDMLAPLGVEHVRVDPRPAGELASGGPPRERVNVGLPRSGDADQGLIGRPGRIDVETAAGTSRQ